MSDRIEQSNPTEGAVVWTVLLETPAKHPEPVVSVTGEADYVLAFLAGVVQWKDPSKSWLLTSVEVKYDE